MVKRNIQVKKFLQIAKIPLQKLRLLTKKGEGLSLGSGFVIDGAGLIVTNFHVIDKAYSIEVNLSDVKYQVTSIEKYDSDVDIYPSKNSY